MQKSSFLGRDDNFKTMEISIRSFFIETPIKIRDIQTLTLFLAMIVREQKTLESSPNPDI